MSRSASSGIGLVGVAPDGPRGEQSLVERDLCRLPRRPLSQPSGDPTNDGPASGTRGKERDRGNLRGRSRLGCPAVPSQPAILRLAARRLAALRLAASLRRRRRGGAHRAAGHGRCDDWRDCRGRARTDLPPRRDADQRRRRHAVSGRRHRAPGAVARRGGRRNAGRRLPGRQRRARRLPGRALRLRRPLPQGLGAGPPTAALRGAGVATPPSRSRQRRGAGTTSPRCAPSGSTSSAWSSTGASSSRRQARTRRRTSTGWPRSWDGLASRGST